MSAVDGLQNGVVKRLCAQFDEGYTVLFQVVQYFRCNVVGTGGELDAVHHTVLHIRVSHIQIAVLFGDAHAGETASEEGNTLGAVVWNGAQMLPYNLLHLRWRGNMVLPRNGKLITIGGITISILYNTVLKSVVHQFASTAES